MDGVTVVVMVMVIVSSSVKPVLRAEPIVRIVRFVGMVDTSVGIAHARETSRRWKRGE